MIATAPSTDSATAVAPVTAELERLRADLRKVQEDLDEVTEDRDRLQQEVNQYEMDWDRRVEVDSGQRSALAHARQVIETAAAADDFARIMNDRAVDAITELLGDR